MNLNEREKIAKEIFEDCLKILIKKGKDYSGDGDCLSNFKRNAERLGLTKYQVWLVYFMKHVDSVCNAIKTNPNDPQVESEPIGERIKDIINYVIILEAMRKEDEYEE